MKRFTGKIQLLKLFLCMLSMAGAYWLLAWISYSPLDNGWTTASSFEKTINLSGSLGAWLADFSLAMFGYLAILLPLALLFVPIYLITFKQVPLITRSKFLIWLASFAIFLIGVCGLLHVMLGRGELYHAGGIIGMWLNMLFEPLLGQVGVLLFALLFLSIGFYFCSGQVLLELLQMLYEWILNGRKPKQQKTEPVQATAETETIYTAYDSSLNDEFASQETELEQAEQEKITEQDEASDTQNLTDLSNFVRPNIIGLNTEKENENTLLHTEEEAPQLPKISLDADLSFLQKSHENDPLAKEVFGESFPETEEETLEIERFTLQPVGEPLLPKISLNQAAKGVQSELSKTVQAEKTAAPAQPRTIKTAPKNQGIFPEIKLHQDMIDQAEWEAQKAREAEQALEAQQAQTKSSNVVVHPLLQRAAKTEKPTTPLPTLDLLDKHSASPQKITEQEIRETSARIEKELANFGVKATVEDVLVGPVVTRYEILPASGVKAAKIANLDTDLARALIFKAIRITDVVPGKPYMGIETPNQHRETVWLRDVLDSNEFRHSNAILPMALGKDISGNPVVVDMAKMPHLLVAGQTGGGKSVGVNTMILSLLFKLTPEQVRFIMIDPKVVELSIYNDIPHLLTPVVTDMKKAENALRWAVEEMERRYQLVSYVQVRNIEGYNSKIEQAEAMNLPIKNPYWKPSDSMDLTAPPLEKMSYIVLIVDEFADLMMSAGKQVEEHIMRIAQKARAVGIHLILATQRPSTDVITGVIKANIPSRIAFTVSSQIDSRTILDKGGAESLLGRGDMLYSGASSPEIIRIHGAFMSDEEVQRVADDWRARGKPEYIESIVAAREETNESSGESSGEIDPLFDEIAAYVVEANVTSISGIQRRFSIGFNRAARIIDQLTEQGILSEPDSRGKREVLAR